jgi:hypothetical protein
MSEAKRKTKVKDKAKGNLAKRLNRVPVRTEDNLPAKIESVDKVKVTDGQISNAQNENQSEADAETVKQPSL